jgi:hypothetical protein
MFVSGLYGEITVISGTIGKDVRIFLRFAYSLVSIMLCQYYWRCHSYSNYERSVAKKKNPHIFLVRTVNVPRFAYRHGEYAPHRL